MGDGPFIVVVPIAEHDDTSAHWIATYTFSATGRPVVNDVQARFRFAEDRFTVQRMELESTASFDRWSASVLYGDYAAQPEIGFLDRRQGILGSGMYKLDANWVLLGAARYDINAGQFDQTRLGLGYIDDCLILAVNYITSYTHSGNVSSDHQVMLQLTLRTLGGTSVSQSVGSVGGL